MHSAMLRKPKFTEFVVQNAKCKIMGGHLNPSLYTAQLFQIQRVKRVSLKTPFGNSTLKLIAHLLYYSIQIPN
jgi:hypothetical protein